MTANLILNDTVIASHKNTVIASLKNTVIASDSAAIHIKHNTVIASNARQSQK